MLKGGNAALNLIVTSEIKSMFGYNFFKLFFVLKNNKNKKYLFGYHFFSFERMKNTENS